MKKMLLKISQTSLENTCAGVSVLINLKIGNLELNSKRDSSIGVFQRIL